MKQYFLLLPALCASLMAVAGNKEKPVDITGSWRETVRQDRGNDPVAFTDTTFYDFLVGGEYTTQHKNASFMYRGNYKVTASMLDLGMRAYNVLEMSKDRMVLKDDGGKYEFRRWDKTATIREDNSAASNGNRAYKETTSGGYVNPAQLTGKWDVYKRTSNTPLSAVDYTTIIRTMSLKTSGNDMSGSVYAARDMEGTPSCKVTRYENGTIYCSGKSARELKVVRCADGELILQEGPITYFFKQFK